VQRGSNGGRSRLGGAGRRLQRVCLARMVGREGILADAQAETILALRRAGRDKLDAWLVLLGNLRLLLPW